MGRWPNKDPLEEEGGMNLYNAFQNNPVNNIDLNGKVGLIEWGALTVIVIVAGDIIVHESLKVQKAAMHTCEWKVINDTYHETGQCSGFFVRNAVGKIIVSSSNKAAGDFEYDVHDTKVFFYSQNGQVHILVYALSKVTDKKTGRSYEDMTREDDWYHPTPSDWCCK
jgi:hypothetical protein